VLFAAYMCKNINENNGGVQKTRKVLRMAWNGKTFFKQIWYPASGNLYKYKVQCPCVWGCSISMSCEHRNTVHLYKMCTVNLSRIYLYEQLCLRLCVCVSCWYTLSFSHIWGVLENDGIKMKNYSWLIEVFKNKLDLENLRRSGKEIWNFSWI
jgi:hypothetical protein